MLEKRYEAPAGTVRYWISADADRAAPWLVLLPGLTADHRLFDRQIEHFEGSVGCMVWDPPGHASSRPYAAFSLEDWARTLQGIIEAEGLQAPVLVGQSMGGYVAQMHLELFPGVAVGFVSIDSAPLGRSYFTGIELWMLKHTEAMYRMIPWGLLLSWGPSGTAHSPYGRALMREMMEEYTPRAYAELTGKGFRALAEAVESRRAFRIPCPIRLLCGEHDEAASTRRYNRAWHKTEGWPLIWVPDAGHNANCDNPEFVNGVIEDMLREVRRDGS